MKEPARAGYPSDVDEALRLVDALVSRNVAASHVTVGGVTIAGVLSGPATLGEQRPYEPVNLYKNFGGDAWNRFAGGGEE